MGKYRGAFINQSGQEVPAPNFDMPIAVNEVDLAYAKGQQDALKDWLGDMLKKGIISKRVYNQYAAKIGLNTVPDENDNSAVIEEVRNITKLGEDDIAICQCQECRAMWGHGYNAGFTDACKTMSANEQEISSKSTISQKKAYIKGGIDQYESLRHMLKNQGVYISMEHDGLKVEVIPTVSDAVKKITSAAWDDGYNTGVINTKSAIEKAIKEAK